MSEHYQLTPSPIVQRYHFNSRSRKQGESVATFVARLKRLAEHCAYGDALNEMLRDRLVVGINDSRIQQRLLAEPELTYKKAYELTLAAEAAEKNAKDLQGHCSESLHALKQDSPKQQPQRLTCYRCGGNHLAPECRFKNATCRQCGKRGHISKVCRSSRPPKNRTASNRTHQLQADTPTASTTDPEYTLYHVSNNSSPLVVTVSVNNTTLPMEVDTRATKSIISERTYRQLWGKNLALPLQETDTKLRTYTGETITILGSLHVQVSYGGQTAPLELLVVAGKGPSLMGRDWPGIDKDIEAKVKDCYSCQQNQRAPSRAPLHPWDWPRKPWTRLHIDHAGPFLGKMFFLLIDAHSKWLEVRTVPSANSHFTIQALRSIFATHGLPEVLVSDNGTAFTSAEFREFVSLNGIRHHNYPLPPRI